MSKWGRVEKYTAKMKFENQPDEAFDMVVEMSAAVIDRDKEIDGLKDKVMYLQEQLMMSKATEGHLKGYVERVKELDPPQPAPERRVQ